MGFNFSGTGGSSGKRFDFSQSRWEDNSDTIPYDITPTPQPISIKPDTTPISPSAIFKMRSAHSPTVTPQQPSLATAWAKGTLGSLVGKAVTPLVEKVTGKEIDLSTLPESNTLGQKALGLVGNLGADLPLWLAGDALLAKPLAAIAKTKPIAKAISSIPKIAPALGTGIRAGSTYGLPINALETAVEGDGVEGFADRLKDAPLMALGGTALHGAGQLAVKGAKTGVDYAKFNKLTKLPETTVNPLEAVQNAYKAPSLRDAKAKRYSELFSGDAKPLATEQNVSIRRPLARQGMTEAELLAQRQLDAQSVFGDPIKGYGIKQTIKPGQKTYEARQAELSEVFKDFPIGSVDTPVARKTLQEGIDSSLGIGGPKGEYGGLDAFGKPLKTFKKNTDTQDAITEISTKMTKQLNDIAKSLKQVEGQTGIESIRKKVKDMGGIRQANDGIFEERRVIPNWIRNDKGGRPLDEVADTLGMSSDELLAAISDSNRKIRNYAAEAQAIANKDPEYQALSNTLETLRGELPGKKTLNSMPELKPREITPKSELIQPQRLGLSGSFPVNNPVNPPIRPPLKPRALQGPQPMESIQTERVLPKQEPLIWTNREGLSSQGGIKPIQSITEQNLENLPKSQIRPLSRIEQGPIKPPTGEIPKTGLKINPPLPKEERLFWQSVSKELYSKGEQPPFSVELMKKDIVEGKLDISKLSNQEDVRRLLKMDLQRFAEGPGVESVGASRVQGELPTPQSEIIIGKPKESTSFKDSLKNFYTRVINRKQRIDDVSKLDGSDTGILASNSENVGGVVDYIFQKELVDKTGNKVGESLQKTLEVIPKGKEKDFWTYMSQRHNIDRAAEGKNVQANYTPEMSTEAVRIAEQANPEYKAIGDGIVKWISDFMETWGVNTGIVNKEMYGNLRQMYKSYFPTQREFSELEKSIPDGLTKKFADQRVPIQKATSSKRDIKDPTENIMNLVSKVVRTAKYNEVGQSLLNSVRSNPEKLKPFAEVISVKDGMFANTDNVISVLENGKANYLRINDKALLDAMNGLPKSIGNVPYVTALTNGIKGLITQKNPLFAIRNMARDFPTAYIYGSEKNPLKFGAGLFGAGKDIITNSPRIQKYRAVGGGGANFFNSGDTTKSAAEIMGKGKRDTIIRNISGKVGDSRAGKITVGTVDSLLHPIKTIEKFNNLTETMPRLAEFNRVLERTGDVNKALFAANDVTVNFSRGGNISKGADKLGGMYINASVQGIDKFFRSFKNPAVAVSTLVKAGITITAPDIALYMINKDNPHYQALDNRSKDAYFQIPDYRDVDENGIPKTFFKIPKSRELGVLFGSFFERAGRTIEGQEDSFKGFANTVATNFAPANPIESSLYTPIFNTIKTNKDFADRPIVPQAMIMDKRSRYLQYDERTTSIAKAIGELSSKVSKEGLSPKQLDYLAKSYTGVIGQLGIPLATPGGSPSKAIKTQFSSDPIFSNQASADFYDKLDKLSTEATNKNLIEKIPSKKLTNEENIKNSMQGVSSALSRATKQINKIQATDDPNKDDYILTIRKQMLDLMTRANSAKDPKAMQLIENKANTVFKK